MTHGPMREVFQNSTQAGRSQNSSPFGTSLPQEMHFGRRNSFHQAFSLRHMAMILALLSLSATAEARPRWRTLGRIALYGAAIASTVESAHQTNLCRDRTEISRCN